MAVVGEGEANRYLKQVLERNSEICDKIIIWGDNPDQETIKVCKSFKKVKYYHCQDKLWEIKEWFVKEQLLNLVLKENPDWILPFDADEIYDKRFDRKMAEEIAKRDEIAYFFYIVQLWDREDQMRVDNGWGGFWNIRYYKNKCKDFGINFYQKPTHCGLAPKWAYEYGAMSGLIVKHYGYLKAEDRIKKIERYKKIDPDAKYQSRRWYQSMEETPVLKPFNEDEFIKNLYYQPKWSNIKTKPKRNIMKYYSVKNKYGKIVEVPENILNEVLKREGMQNLGEITQPAIESPVIEFPEEAKDELVCPICGYEGKNKQALKMHRLRKKH